MVSSDLFFCSHMFLCSHVLLSSHGFCLMCFYLWTQVKGLASLAHIALSYCTVCRNELIPTRLLVDALRFLSRTGLLNILFFCKLRLLWSYGIMGFWYVCSLILWAHGLMFWCGRSYGLMLWCGYNWSRSTPPWWQLACRGGNPQRTWQFHSDADEPLRWIEEVPSGEKDCISQGALISLVLDS